MNSEILKSNLIYLRKEKGLTQKELSEKLNYSDKVISKWERGESIPDIEALNQIALFYGKSLDDLVSSNINVFMTIDEPTSQLEPKFTKDSSRFFKLSFWIAVIIYLLLFASSIIWSNLIILISASIMLPIYTTIYSIIVQNVIIEAKYKGHIIKVAHKITNVKLFIDGKLVDELNNAFLANMRMSGRIEGDLIKVHVFTLLTVKCDIFVE